MIGDILVKVAKGDLLTQEEARILLEWGQALNNAPDLFGQLFKGLSSVGTLADITRDLGTVNRGAFISGNAGDPLDASGNNPFTGVAMMSPGIPVLSGADEASIFGMNSGTLTFWLSNLTGKVLAGGGEVELDDDGIFVNIPATLNTINSYKFGDISTGTIYSAWYAFRNVALKLTESWLHVTDVSSRKYIRALGTGTDNWQGGNIFLAAINGDLASNNINEVNIEWRTGLQPITVFNNRGHNVDFQVKGDTDDNVVYVDASADKVGIGNSTPSYKLDVNGDVNVSSGSVYRINGTQLDAGDVPITDSGGYFTATDVEAALQEAAPKLVTNGNSHNHVGGDGADLTYLDAILAYASGTSQVPAGTTYYFFPHITSMQSGIGAIIYPVAGTMKNMAVRLSSAQPGTGSLVITLMKNLSATALVITIPAGSAGGTTHSNTVNTVTWNANDLLTWRIVNNASSTSGSVTSFTMQQERTTT